MFVVGVVADIVNAHIDQSPLAGTLQNAGFKVGRKTSGRRVNTSNCMEGFYRLYQNSVRRLYLQLNVNLLQIAAALEA